MWIQWKGVAVLALVSFHCAIAQTTGVIRGTIKDPSGAVIGGAKDHGDLPGHQCHPYSCQRHSWRDVFPTLPVEKYTVEIEAASFKKYSNRDLDVTIGHVIVVDAALELGEVSQVITAEAPTLTPTAPLTRPGARFRN